jgi:hypothetical protein
MTLHRSLAAAAFAGFLALGAAAAQAAVVYRFDVDTSSLPAGTQGFIDLQFSASQATGPGAYNPLATATVSGFQNVGGFFTEADPYAQNDLFGTPNVSGHVSGTLPGSVVFDVTGDGAINDYLHSLQFGSSFSFLLTLSGQAVDAPICPNTGGTDCSLPGFALDLLNSAGTGYLLTGDPDGQTAFSWTLAQVQVNTDGSTTPTIYPGPGGGAPALTISTPVPEPATWVMMIVGFGAVGLGLRRRTARLAAA